MNSLSPKALKKSQNLLRKVGQKVEQTFNLSNSNVFHGSLSSLNDLPDSYYHREIGGDQKSEQEDTISLQNLPEYDSDSPKKKLQKKHGKIYCLEMNTIVLYFSCSFWSFTCINILQ